MSTSSNLCLSLFHTRASFVSVYHESTCSCLACSYFVSENRRFSQTFLNFVGVVLHSVKITGENQTNQQYAQFVQVSFTMPQRYQPANTTSDPIPFSSVRIGRDIFM